MFLIGSEFDKELEKREQLIGDLERKRAKKTLNIIGFDTYASSQWKPSKSCIHCHVTLEQNFDLQTKENLPGLRCYRCGKQYNEEQAPIQEGLRSKHGKTRSRIITAKTRKKRYFDSSGNEINQDDKDIMNLIAQGYQIKCYHEEVVHN